MIKKILYQINLPFLGPLGLSNHLQLSAYQSQTRNETSSGPWSIEIWLNRSPQSLCQFKSHPGCENLCLLSCNSFWIVFFNEFPIYISQVRILGKLFFVLLQWNLPDWSLVELHEVSRNVPHRWFHSFQSNVNKSSLLTLSDKYF